MQRLVKIILNLFSRKFLIKTSLLLKPVLELILTGNRFHDPINNKSYSYFFPYGYNKLRNNALSPGTLSLERHRLLWVFLKNETDFFNKGNKILHIAPEQCFYKNFKENFVTYITCDLNSPLAEIKADVCNLPFKENHVIVITEASVGLSAYYQNIINKHKKFADKINDELDNWEKGPTDEEMFDEDFEEFVKINKIDKTKYH